MNTISKTGTLSLGNVSTYLWATAFVAGNVLLPQLCHAVNLGGKAFLPIMLFTLIGAARYGLTVGALTAIFSPLVSFAITGMPSGAQLGVLLAASLLIVASVGTFRAKGGRFTLPAIVAIVASYQLATLLISGIFFLGLETVWANLLLSWPGILIQMAALWAVTRK